MTGWEQLRAKVSQVVRRLITDELKSANIFALKISGGVRFDVLELKRSFAPFGRVPKDSPSVT